MYQEAHVIGGRRPTRQSVHAKSLADRKGLQLSDERWRLGLQLDVSTDKAPINACGKGGITEKGRMTDYHRPRVPRVSLPGLPGELTSEN